VIIVSFFSGCSQKIIYQVNGQSIADNSVHARIMSMNITIRYNFVSWYEVQEDDEKYTRAEYFGFNKTQKLKKSSCSSLPVSVFNPGKNKYKIITFTEIEGEVLFETLYSGDLSTNMFYMKLPVIENKKIIFYYRVYNKDSITVFESFRAQYIIEG